MSGKPPIRYGMRAARPSPRAASNAPAMRSRPDVSAIETLEPRDRLGQVLVASAGEAQDVITRLARILEQPRDRVGGLERRDDALEACQLSEGAQRLVVSDGRIQGPTAVPQMGVLGADARVVQTGGDRVRLEDLAVLISEHRRHRSVEDPEAPGAERGSVAPGLEPLPPGLDPDELDRVVEERGEEADGVRPTAHARDDPLRQRVLDLERLRARLVADHALQVAHEGRIRSRSNR